MRKPFTRNATHARSSRESRKPVPPIPRRATIIRTPRSRAGLSGALQIMKSAAILLNQENGSQADFLLIILNHRLQQRQQIGALVGVCLVDNFFAEVPDQISIEQAPTSPSGQRQVSLSSGQAELPANRVNYV